MNAERSSDKPRGRVVIFDDEVPMGRILVKALGMQGFDAKAFSNPVEGLEALEGFQPDVLLTDHRMPEMSGSRVLEHMRREWPDVPVLILTAYGTVEGAVEAMQAGAFNYITKPFEQSNLVAQIERALEHRRIQQENARLSEQMRGGRETRQIIGTSAAIEGVRELIARAAPTDSSVLITGPSGVGKELVATAIHLQSRRATKRFVAINCPSIPPNLIESEMFGYERGAFTGADRTKLGLVELAEGGTLFLDEVAELPSEMQVKLLRVIQEREIQRVGGLKQLPIDLRLVAATNRDLQTEMKAGRFREDLFFRLNVVNIEIPPLRERLEDIPEMARHFLQQIGRRMMRPDLRLSEGAIRALQGYEWPGNVRELENVLERAVVLSSSAEIDEGELTINPRHRLGARPSAAPVPHGPTGEGSAAQARRPLDYREARDRFERDYFRQLLEAANDNMTKAAQLSGISRRNLYDKLDKLNVEKDPEANA